jgi:hypothetical protein
MDFCRLVHRACSRDTLDRTQNPYSSLATTSSTTAPLKSSSAPPANTASKPDDLIIPKNILAFRLITKLLQKIPQTQPFVSKDNLEDNNWEKEDRQEVRISNAFAHLAISDHGTIAIATNRYSTPSSLGIMACATLNLHHDTPTPRPDSFFKKVWKILVTKNARYDDPPSSNPTIETPVQPSEYSKFENLNAYMKNLEENW